MPRGGTIRIRILGDNRHFQATLGKSKRSMDRFAGSMKAGFGGAVKSLGGVALAGGVAAAGAAVGQFVAKSVNQFATFEASMNKVFTLMPDASAEARDKMTADLRRVAREGVVPLEQVTQSAYQALSAGVDTSGLNQFLDVATELSRGGFADLSTTVSGLSAAVNAYGADTLSAQQAADMMLTTQNMGITTVDELSRSLGNVTPIAASLGVGFDEVGASLSALTSQAGGNTAQATTQLRAALSELGKEGSKAFRAFEDATGQTFPAFVAGGGSLQQALGVMAQHADGTGIRVADLFGSIEAGMAATVLTSETGSALFGDAMTAMATSAGATEAANAQMAQGLRYQWDRIKGFVSDGMVSVGQRIGSGLVAIGGWWTEHRDQILGVVEPFWESLRGVVESAMGAIRSVVDVVLMAVRWVWDTFGQDILAAVRIAWDLITARVQIGFDLIKGIFETFKAVFTGDWSGAWEAIKDTGKRIWDTITGTFGDILDTLRGSWESAWSEIKWFFENIWWGIRSVAEKAINGLIGLIEEGLNAQVRVINSMIRQINRIPKVSLPEIEQVVLRRVEFVGDRPTRDRTTSGGDADDAVVALSSGAADAADAHRELLAMFGITPTTTGTISDDGAPSTTVSGERPSIEDEVRALAERFELGTEFGGIGAAEYERELNRLLSEARSPALLDAFERGGLGTLGLTVAPQTDDLLPVVRALRRFKDEQERVSGGTGRAGDTAAADDPEMSVAEQVRLLGRLAGLGDITGAEHRAALENLQADVEQSDLAGREALKRAFDTLGTAAEGLVTSVAEQVGLLGQMLDVGDITTEAYRAALTELQTTVEQSDLTGRQLLKRAFDALERQTSREDESISELVRRLGQHRDVGDINAREYRAALDRAAGRVDPTDLEGRLALKRAFEGLERETEQKRRASTPPSRAGSTLGTGTSGAGSGGLDIGSGLHITLELDRKPLTEWFVPREDLERARQTDRATRGVAATRAAGGCD